jgi:hypothetical protein
LYRLSVCLARLQLQVRVVVMGKFPPFLAFTAAPCDLAMGVVSKKINIRGGNNDLSSRKPNADN